MDSEGLNILIVEDSPAVRAVMGMTLKMSKLSNLKLLEAQDGLEGLRLLRRERIDVVFTDISMPRMDGLEMIDRMRADASLRDIPVVVVTYRDGSTGEAALQERNLHRVLNKPFKPKEVFDILEAVLSPTCSGKARLGTN